MDHPHLYEQLVWNELSSGSALSADGSVDVEGVMRGFVKNGRVVLKFAEQRVVELVAANRGAAYTGNNRPGWLMVDPGVDEATFRELFHEAVGGSSGWATSCATPLTTSPTSARTDDAMHWPGDGQHAEHA